MSLPQLVRDQRTPWECDHCGNLCRDLWPPARCPDCRRRSTYQPSVVCSECGTRPPRGRDCQCVPEANEPAKTGMVAEAGPELSVEFHDYLKREAKSPGLKFVVGVRLDEAKARLERYRKFVQRRTG